jgi:predicted ABC-type ATPase
VAEDEPKGIYVLAGCNGAGKSSVLGRDIALVGGHFVNPDELTKHVLDRDDKLNPAEVNSQVWYQMRDRLRDAINEGTSYAFETTLGGNTITALLLEAIAAGREVHVAFVGLETVELHIERVARRVEQGGHDVPEERIRARYNSSREHLIQLLSGARNVWVYDNSTESDPTDSDLEPKLLLHTESGRVIDHSPFEGMPAWAKPIVAAALRL